jgi:ABC-2 type transport system permease protein/oleandomycin transport system permease protein
VKSGLSNTLQILKRNVKRNFRIPQLLVFSSIQPVIFLLLFNFVFGGAIAKTGSIKYINFLLPGILAQTALFGAIQTGVGLAEDLGKGAIDRLRSLPIARYAVLFGRTTADSVRNLFVILLMSGVGFLLGFRYQEGLPKFMFAAVLILIFSFAFSGIERRTSVTVKYTFVLQNTIKTAAIRK